MGAKSSSYSTKGAIWGFVIAIISLFLYGWALCNFPFIKIFTKCYNFLNYVQIFPKIATHYFFYILIFTSAGFIIGLLFENSNKKKKSIKAPPRKNKTLDKFLNFIY